MKRKTHALGEKVSRTHWFYALCGVKIPTMAHDKVIDCRKCVAKLEKIASPMVKK